MKTRKKSGSRGKTAHKAAIQRINIAGGTVSLQQVETELREAEAALAGEGKLGSGATLLRVDLDKRDRVSSIVFEGDSRLQREVAGRLRKGRSKAKIASTTLRSAAAILKD